MINKYKSYPKYKDSGVECLRKVPEHWEMKPIKFLLHCRKGSVKTGPFGSHLKSSDMNGFDIKVYNQRTVIDNDFFSGEAYITFKKYQDLKTFEVFYNDILITTRGTIGSTAIVPKDVEKGILHPCIIRMQIDTNKALNEFIAMLVQDGFYVLEQIKIMSNSTTIEVIYSENLINVDIALPRSIEEQLTIMAFLDYETGKIDELIEKQQNLIALLEEKRQAVISHAVTKGLNPNAPMKDSGVEWLGEVPEHWKMKPLKYLCSFSGGGTPRKDNLQYWTDGNIPWVSAKDMKKFWITDTQDKITLQAVSESSTNLLASGALLMVVRSGILQRMIPIAINKVEVTLNQDMKALRFNSLMHNEYAANYIHGNQQPLLLEWSKEGATVESIEHEFLANSIFPLPPIEEQIGINKYLKSRVDVFDKLINQAKSAIELLHERRTALISAAVTGKIDVRGFESKD